MPDPNKLKVARQIDRRGIFLAMARVPNSERVLYGGSDFKLYEIDFAAEKPEPAEFEGHQSYITGVALTEKLIVTGGYDRHLIWWDLETKQQVLKTENAHAKWIRGVEASPDGKLIATVADDMVARIWEVEAGKLKHELRGHAEQTPHHYPSMLFGCAFSRDGKHLATVDKIGHIIVWDVETGQQKAALDAPENYTWDPKNRRHSIGGLRSAAFSPDGRLLAVGGMGQVGNIDHLEGKARVEIFDWAKGEKTHEYADCSSKGLVQCLCWHPQAEWLMAAGGGAGDGWTAFFKPDEPKKAFKEEKAPMFVHEMSLSDDGGAVWAVGHQKLVKWVLES
jgi:WD40 repeat protein